jgi:hypothetical protein
LIVDRMERGLRRLNLDRFRDANRLGHYLAVQAHSFDMKFDCFRDQSARIFEGVARGRTSSGSGTYAAEF